MKKILTRILALIPPIIAVKGLMACVNEYHYPVWSGLPIIFTLIFLIPSYLLMVQGEHARKRTVILCALCMPLVFLSSAVCVVRSETTDFRNYRDLDADCLANRDTFFQELFPKWPRYFVQPLDQTDAIYLDADYYYHFLLWFDYTYDICAEWPLEQEEFDAEIQRVQALFDGYDDVVTIQKGPYTCLIRYDGDEPFQPVDNSYHYYMFAYDPDALRVRYICCDSLEDGADQPYYLSMDWE